jgi:hypothetical protein
MHYLVRGELVEDAFEAMSPRESALYFQQVVKPSIEALWELAEEKKRTVRGVTSGWRENVFVVEAASSDEVARLLRSLPFGGVIRWNVSPIESLESALQSGREARRAGLKLVVER